MEELQQLEELHEDDCELAFESVKNLFPALERNGTEIRTGIPMTSAGGGTSFIKRRGSH